MSTTSFEMSAEVRNDTGKNAARRTRHNDMIPAVLYGAGKDPVKLTLNHNAVINSLKNEAVYSHILTLTVGGKQEKAVLKAMQRHPFKPRIMHMDFQRVSDTTRIRMNVPLHFTNQDKAPGVKVTGGIVTHLLTSVEVLCQAKDLPEYVEVDLSNLQAGHPLHLSDITLPAGVKIAALLQGKSHDLPVVSITIPRAVEEAAPAAAAAAPAEGAAAAAPAAGGEKK